MGDDYTKSQWFTAFVCAAQVAGDDPHRNAELVRQLRIVGDLLDSPQLLQQRQNDALAGVGEISVSQNQLLNSRVSINPDGNPAQVA
jgi:hypothetical protein